MSAQEEITRAALERVLSVYAGGSQNGIDDLKAASRPDFRFRDPFSDVRGFDAVMAHFGVLGTDHVSVKWDVRGKAVNGTAAYLRWRYTAEYRDGTRTDFDGMSEFLFDEEGRFAAHIDYFDAIEPIAQRRADIGAQLVKVKAEFHI